MSQKLLAPLLIEVLIQPLSLKAGDGELLHKMNCATSHRAERRQKLVSGKIYDIRLQGVTSSKLGDLVEGRIFYTAHEVPTK